MTRPRYGLQRDGLWLMPPAFDLKATSLTDDPGAAWVASSIDAAILRRDLLCQALGIITTILPIPPQPTK